MEVEALLSIRRPFALIRSYLKVTCITLLEAAQWPRAICAYPHIGCRAGLPDRNSLFKGGVQVGFLEQCDNILVGDSTPRVFVLLVLLFLAFLRCTRGRR
jgi:hypothetical protein